MLTLLTLLIFGVYTVVSKNFLDNKTLLYMKIFKKKLLQTPTCRTLTYTPPSLFQFAQQIFWDPRTNSIYVADADGKVFSTLHTFEQLGRPIQTRIPLKTL